MTNRATVTETVTVQEVIESATHLTKPDDQWGASELRDYVREQIIKVHGPYPVNDRTPAKELAIMKSFVARWQPVAGWMPAAIARAAFAPPHNGYWIGHSPITMERFSKNNDPYFSHPLAESIVEKIEERARQNGA